MYLTNFHQTYINDALRNRDERFTFRGQKVKGQGHGGITCAGNSAKCLRSALYTLDAEPSS